MSPLYGESFSLRDAPRATNRKSEFPVFLKHLAFILIFVISFFIANLYTAQAFLVPGSKDRIAGAARPELRTPAVASALAELEKPNVCIIMDDVGENEELLNTLPRIPFPLTLSVMPDCQYTKSSADWAHNHGYEVMVHLPMQPLLYPEENPGRHALLVSMDRQTLLQETSRALSEVPYAAGVNNHMGSLFTTNRAKLDVVLDVLAQRNLYFIDSRTSVRSIGYEMAHEKGLRCGERSLFLDDINDREPIRQRFEELLGLARRNGQAVGICHFRPETVAVLSHLDPHTFSDIQFTYPSRVVR